MPHKTPQPLRWLAVFQSLGLLLLAGYLDYATGYDISFFLFYLIPILFALHRLGLRAALVMSVLSALTWWFSNYLAGQPASDWLMQVWNTWLRLMVFLLVVGLLANRGKLEKEVRQNTAALTRLEKAVLEASEREQRNIGHDLHDSLCQHLTATALAGKVLAKELAAAQSAQTAAASHLVGLIEQGIQMTRTLARSLHPVGMQEEEGLVDGLRELAAGISKNFSVSCILKCPATISLATAEANTHLYRIAQEAISNAIRHGRARKIILHLETVEDEIVFTITDDGTGLPADAGSGDGMGLHIMNYRAGMIGADLQVKRLPDRGTRVTCVLPAGSPGVSINHHVGQN